MRCFFGIRKEKFKGRFKKTQLSKTMWCYKKAVSGNFNFLTRLH